ncbi:tripartite tricarboxylate transporter permease [Citricoccus nitrophenolicus]|uniref:Tripartite tricarboxylate transporter permease n=1 Tax=Citricoccus nitrophenolicus TaxID=863575 RepID=A0ABV0IIT1_9MICC
MDLMQNMLNGFSVALEPENLLFCLVGVLLGTVIGMLPGMGSASGVAVLLPLTLTLDPVTALIMLAGLYYGTEYGSTISAVLISTPGDGAALVTVIDGHQMALKGRAGQALAIAAISSFIAGTISVVFLSVLAPFFAAVSLNFGPPEMFALMLLGLLTVGGIIGRNPLKGILMAVVGAMIAMVGIDSQTSTLRFAFDRAELYSGVSLVAVVVGIVALAELATQGASGHMKPIRTRFRDMILSRKDLRKASGAIGRGGLLGFIIGVLPGAGPTLATFFTYGVEQRIAKDKSQFGHGDIRGVAAPEASNNAAVNGAFIPTLTLGIPGSATTAILLGAFILFDIQPGPQLFEQQGDLVWGLIASFYIGNVLLLALNLPLAPVFASVLRIKYTYLYPVVLIVAVVAAYAVSSRLFDAFLAAGLAVFGVLMKQHGYPVAPLVLGLVLGGMVEAELRRSLAIGDGTLGIFLDRPIALLILGLAVLLIAVPQVVRVLRRGSSHGRLAQPAESTKTGVEA